MTGRFGISFRNQPQAWKKQEWCRTLGWVNPVSGIILAFIKSEVGNEKFPEKSYHSYHITPRHNPKELWPNFHHGQSFKSQHTVPHYTPYSCVLKQFLKTWPLNSSFYSHGYIQRQIGGTYKCKFIIILSVRHFTYKKAIHTLNRARDFYFFV